MDITMPPVEPADDAGRRRWLMIAGTADRFFAPPYAYEGLFKMIGSARKDFRVFEGLDHVSIMVSKRARTEVWPLLLQFLNDH